MLEEASGQVRLERRHIAAATIGNALEFYDFFAYGLFAIQIGHAFFPSDSAYLSLMGSLATFGAGFLTRPLGAIVIGSYADRAGRKPAMMLSFMLIGCSMLGMALIPSFSTMGLAAPVLVIIARLVQGFSVGGEIGSNTAFLIEAAAPGQLLLSSACLALGLTQFCRPDLLRLMAGGLWYCLGLRSYPTGFGCGRTCQRHCTCLYLRPKHRVR